MSRGRSVSRSALTGRLVSGKTASVTQLGDGTYRVSSKAVRSAKTGRFVTGSAASRHPSTSVVESRDERGSSK